MNLVTLGILTSIGGVMMTGMVHNPKFLVIGIGFIIVNQVVMYAAGYTKAKALSKAS